MNSISIGFKITLEIRWRPDFFSNHSYQIVHNRNVRWTRARLILLSDKMNRIKSTPTIKIFYASRWRRWICVWMPMKVIQRPMMTLCRTIHVRTDPMNNRSMHSPKLLRSNPTQRYSSRKRSLAGHIIPMMSWYSICVLGIRKMLHI